jgi:hypothetical protein
MAETAGPQSAACFVADECSERRRSIMAVAMRRANRKDLEQLKAALESRA